MNNVEPIPTCFSCGTQAEPLRKIALQVQDRRMMIATCETCGNNAVGLLLNIKVGENLIAQKIMDDGARVLIMKPGNHKPA